MSKETEINSIEYKLMKIQSELDVPKDNYNEFGKFKYRSAEQIFEKLKPLQEKYKALVTFENQIIQINNHNWYKVSASFRCIEGNKEVIQVDGFAKIPNELKGMNDCQIIGAAHSYALKYALCSLLQVDNGEDADREVKQPKEKTKAQPPQQKDKGLLKIYLLF